GIPTRREQAEKTKTQTKRFDTDFTNRHGLRGGETAKYTKYTKLFFNRQDAEDAESFGAFSLTTDEHGSRGGETAKYAKLFLNRSTRRELRHVASRRRKHKQDALTRISRIDTNYAIMGRRGNAALPG